jgi:hypothetical protein
MSRVESVSQNLYFDSEAELTISHRIHPPRVEECHGYHEFSEDEEIGRELVSFKILLDSGEEMDISSVLTEEMKQKILDCV